MSRVRVVSLCICHQRGNLNESLPSRNLNYHAIPHISGAVTRRVVRRQSLLNPSLRRRGTVANFLITVPAKASHEPT